MKLLARAPIDHTLAGRDVRPGDVFEADAGQARPLLDGGLAEPVESVDAQPAAATSQKRAR